MGGRRAAGEVRTAAARTAELGGERITKGLPEIRQSLFADYAKKMLSIVKTNAGAINRETAIAAYRMTRRNRLAGSGSLFLKPR